MARRAALVKPRKKVTRSAPVVRRGKKLAGPDFTGWESWTGEQFHTFKRNAKYFYYENYQEADLQSEVWTWMKNNKFSVKDIKNAKAAKGWNSISVWAAIACKLVNTGCPDFNKIEADYWNNLPGTEGELQPMSDYINKNVAKAIKSGSTEAEEKVEEDKQVKPTRANIQEIMRDRATEAFGGVETLADEFYIAGYPKEFASRERVLAFLNEQKTLPQHVSRYIKYWESLKAEYEAAKLGKDKDIKEGYSNLTRTQINNLIKFASQIVDDLNAYVAIKQAVRTPRAKKAVPVEKIVSKLKYCKTFKDEALKLDLTSVHPSKLHNSNEAWVYDTKKRKVHHYVADDYTKCLIVKNNTIVGFDKKESGIKTLRKPSEQLKEIMGSKPAARKYFKDIKAVETVPNGRFNSDMVILRAF